MRDIAVRLTDRDIEGLALYFERARPPRPKAPADTAAHTRACGAAEIPAYQCVVDGNPATGRALIARYGCTACHQIPGVRTTSGSVGPPLTGFGQRGYIAGRVPNRPDWLSQWLRDPPSIDPQTAMPPQGISVTEARHIAAYLYTLR
jgi:cytochrome c2